MPSRPKATIDEDAVSIRCPDFDANTLETLTGDDLGQLRRFYLMFQAVCRWQHEALCREASQGHFVEAAQCARRLKVSCFTVGALALGHAYSRIESIASRWDGVELRASLSDIEAQLEYTLANLGDLAVGITAGDFPVRRLEARGALA
jgi:HPt (histidine-containing phosphotransfer) domain-containing protein